MQQNLCTRITLLVFSCETWSASTRYLHALPFDRHHFWLLTSIDQRFFVQVSFFCQHNFVSATVPLVFKYGRACRAFPGGMDNHDVVRHPREHERPAEQAWCCEASLDLEVDDFTTFTALEKRRSKHIFKICERLTHMERPNRETRLKPLEALVCTRPRFQGSLQLTANIAHICHSVLLRAWL